MIDKLKWPLTIVVSLALIAAAAVILIGPMLGIDEQTRATVLEWIEGLGALLAAPLVAILAKDSDGDGIPDVIDPTDDRRAR